MAYERRRLSTESDKSSTSTTYSTESTTTYPIIPGGQNKITKKSSSTNTIKREAIMSSPAELLLARTKNTFIDLNPYFQCSSLPR